MHGRHGNLCEHFVQTAYACGSMAAIPNHRNSIPAVVGQTLTEARDQRRPAEQERTFRITRQDRVISGDHLGPRRRLEVVPVATVTIRWRLVERDDVDSHGSQAMRPVPGAGSHFNEWTDVAQR